MSGHGHSHGGGCSHESHSHDDAELGVQYSLYQKIDLDKLVVYNESVDGAGRECFRAWDDRLDTSKYVESDVDEDILFQIPFTGSVKLKGVLLYGGAGDTHPAQMRLYANATHMSLSDCESSTGDQMFDLQPQGSDAVEYACKPSKFSALGSLAIYFPSNFGAEATRIHYIGLRGEFSNINREQVLIATYEARAMPKDHKGEIPDTNHQDIF